MGRIFGIGEKEVMEERKEEKFVEAYPENMRLWVAKLATTVRSLQTSSKRLEGVVEALEGRMPEKPAEAEKEKEKEDQSVALRAALQTFVRQHKYPVSHATIRREVRMKQNLLGSCLKEINYEKRIVHYAFNEAGGMVFSKNGLTYYGTAKQWQAYNAAEQNLMKGVGE